MKIDKLYIKGQGIQLKEILQSKSLTMKQIAELFGIKENSVKKELNSMIISNQKFISNIEELLRSKLNELIVSVESQVQEYIIRIRKNIKTYTDKEDSKIINELLDLSEQYTDLYHQLIAKGNVALYRFNMGLEWDAVKYLDEIIKVSEKNNFNDLALYYSVQLSYINLYEDIKQSRKILDNAAYFLQKDISDDVLHSYYYFYGIVLNRQGFSRQAREYFEKAEKYAVEDDQKINSLLNISLTYYNEKSYKTALLWNRKAFDKAQLAGNKNLMSTVLNNIANIYIDMGEIERAKWYIEKAMERFNEINELYRKLSIYSTYLELSSKKEEELLQEILILTKYNINAESKPYLQECFKIAFNKMASSKDFATIKKMLKCLVESSEQLEGENDINGELTGVIGMLTTYLIREGAIAI